ncbi:tRNA (adenosine(37)-N6)-dimethylallyltransferase MiaA [Pseudaestuariivita rosea]|uniref:tRNA (adenosine(37)-N6)-dimethylallyltransferase MiaA n=1 Tax=Pseudaestuariivita rosea TaxID=2763263 RepID=UPI001ABA79C0|nr:tRNA (adenosine(37)-N6)-dimethylallyltransferase MiaA [Pseudaestuariivita rosea]
MSIIDKISPELPVLIAGPTAAGKSALALEIAARQGGRIINADALQVFSNWHILTARPTSDDMAQADHALYGHIDPGADYSVGHWLRQVQPLLSSDQRPIIVGGTGLYFKALTEGLVDIPATPAKIRAQADRKMATEGREAMLAELDTESAKRIDKLNPMRVQRAWEVFKTTGRGIVTWQDITPAPFLPLSQTQPIVTNANKDWLNQRIVHRFDHMLQNGAIEEARQNMPHWDPSALWARAIGAPELIAYLQGKMSLDQAREAAIISSRQYAKRQRTWFRARMQKWQSYACPLSPP